MEPFIIFGIVVGVVASIFILTSIGVTVYAIVTDRKNSDYLRI